MGVYQGLCSGIVTAALLISTSACSWQKKEADLDAGEPVRVQIPFSVDGNYHLQIVELFTLTNLSKLQGLAAKFLIDPTTTGNRLHGRNPQFRYMKDQDG